MTYDDFVAKERNSCLCKCWWKLEMGLVSICNPNVYLLEVATKSFIITIFFIHYHASNPQNRQQNDECSAFLN